jgi:uncharacterized repeat protein (TIGR02543 family)
LYEEEQRVLGWTGVIGAGPWTGGLPRHGRRFGTDAPPAQFTVTFNANGGTVTPASVEVETGKTATLPAAPTKTGGDTVFQGWYTANGTSDNNWGSRFTDATPVTAHITVYAKWGSSAPTQYTVTFNSQGGSEVSSVTVNSGDTLGTLPAPTRTGYTFGGWFTQANGGGEQFTGITQVTGKITVHAKWTAQSGGSAKKLTITGISGLSSSNIVVGLSADQASLTAGGSGTISGGSVTIQLKNGNGQGGFGNENWTGSGQYAIALWLTSSGGGFSGNPQYVTAKITFSNETTTVVWSQFEPFNSGGEGKKLTITEISGLSSSQIFVGIVAPQGHLTAGGSGTISGGSVTIQLKNGNGQGGLSNENWTSSGQYKIALWLTSSGGGFSGDPQYLTEHITFSNETTTVAWSQFEPFNSGGEGKKLTITGISGLSSSDIVVGLSADQASLTAGEYGTISGGSVTIQLKNGNGQGGFSNKNWTGSGSFYIALWLTSGGGNFSGGPQYVAGPITFSNETTTVSWSQFGPFNSGGEKPGGGEGKS